MAAADDPQQGGALGAGVRDASMPDRPDSTDSPTAAAEDELFVLTAAMLTPQQFPGVLGDDYPAACTGLGLSPVDAGYGLVFGQDGTGARWTVVTTDAAMVACALAAWDCGLEYDLSPGEATMAASLPGWPLPVAVSVPGLPEPFDPDEETGGGPPLAPPDASAWGPAQRRLGADEIAVRWSEWRDRFEADSGAAGAGSDAPAPHPAGVPGTAAGTGRASAAGGTGEEPGPGTAGASDPAAESAPDPGEAATATAAHEDGTPPGTAAPAHSPVRRVLAAAEEYVRTPPPPGRVRIAYGAVRADGPGWSLVGRTDDMAFVLVDEAPGHVLPVGVGPALPTLLTALSALATAPTGRPA